MMKRETGMTFLPVVPSEVSVKLGMEGQLAVLCLPAEELNAVSRWGVLHHVLITPLPYLQSTEFCDFQLLLCLLVSEGQQKVVLTHTV